MKRILLSLLLSLATLLPAYSMSYEEARQQAWFLTDKMAYELNLTPEQYDRAYQINLDYLMSIRTASDCDGYYWRYRDADFRCILFDWQYSLYTTLDYFFRPVRWVRSAWYYPVFDRYRVGYYYFDRPSVYVSYRGGMWNRRGHESRSPYYAYRPTPGYGMRNHYADGPRPYYDRPQPPRPGDRPGRPGQMRPDNGSRPDAGARPGTDRPGWNAGRPGNNRPQGGNNRPQGNDNRPNRPNGNTPSSPSRGHSNESQRPSMNRGNASGGFRQVGNSSGSSSSASTPARGHSSSSRRANNGAGGRTFGR